MLEFFMVSYWTPNLLSLEMRLMADLARPSVASRQAHLQAQEVFAFQER